MIRYLTWSLFILFTLGTVDFDVIYSDGLHLRYKSWLENLIEKVKGK
jgi:hypothetical protein